jgi:hypothetical protein
MMFDGGGDAMKVNVDEFKHALDMIGDAGGAEAAIVAQFALDLAVTARFQRADKPMTPERAHRLLHLRIARHRTTQYARSGTVH